MTTNFLAIVNEETNKVENITVPWQAPVGFYAVETDVGAIGDTYDPETGEFTKPEQDEVEDV